MASIKVWVKLAAPGTPGDPYQEMWMAKKHLWIPAVAGGVALTLIGGVAVATAMHKNDVVISVDGVSQTIAVREDTVQEVLDLDGITVGEHDVVLPSPETKITDGMEISVLYGRKLDLTVDGEARTVWTTALTVEEALNFLGLNDPDAKLSAARTTPIGREGLALTVLVPRNVTIDVAGTPVEVKAAGTVGDALTAAQVTPDEDDVVTPAADTSLTDGLAITYTNVEQKTETKDVPIPFEKEEKESADLAKGKTKVDTEGVDGVKTETHLEVYHNGTLVSSELQSEEVTKEPVKQVTLVGTKEEKKKETSTKKEESSSNPSNPGEDGSGSAPTPANGSSCQASYYWQGQKTANGEQFNPSDLTAAHKSLPFNSRVKVTNPNNGKTVVVRINDRGPYVSGRCLDLSKAAMETIGGTSSGVLTVNYEVL